MHPDGQGAGGGAGLMFGKKEFSVFSTFNLSGGRDFKKNIVERESRVA
jgi:hypothetical protein